MVKDAAVSMAEAKRAVALGEINGKKIELPKHKVPVAVEGLIIEEFDRRGLSALTPVNGSTIAKLMYIGLREGAENVLDESKNIITRLIGELADNFGQLSHGAQTKVLTEAMAPEPRVEKLACLDWQIISSANGCAILPDCTCIAFDGTDWTSLFLTNTEHIQSVVLPLTPALLAVGTTGSEELPNLENFDQLATQVSHTFFLSSCRRDELDDLLLGMGDQVQSQIGNLTNSAVSEALEGFLSTGEPVASQAQIDRAASQSWVSEQDDGQISFSVSLRDFGDAALATEVSGALKSVLGVFAQNFPISGVEGFTFANDYRGALNSIDRGFETYSDLQTTENEKYVGVTMPVPVLRDGRVKMQIVCRSSVALDLVSDEGENRYEAISVILHSLASAALTNLLQNKFPDQILARISDEYEGLLYQSTSGIFDACFCASISCSSARLLQLYEELAADALEKVLENVPSERRAYREHGNMDILFPAVSRMFGDFLNSTARLLGGQKNQEAELAEDSRLWLLLEANNLLAWFELFGKDLESFDEGLEGWEKFEDIFFVNRHYERIAAQFSIVPEPTDASGVYVHVPEAPDIDLLDIDD